MFGRVSRSAYVCLGCQRRLARQDTLQNRLSPCASAFPARRWQSASALRPQDDDEPPDTLDDTVSIQYTPTSSLRSKNKVWRMNNQAADLGIDSLGEPVKVIILPDRDLKPDTKPTTDIETDRTDLRASLNSESQPISWQQVKNNIDAIKAEVKDEVSELGDSKYGQLLKKLRSGFTKDQLKKYISQKAGALDGDIRHVPLGNARTKGTLAAHILTQMWKLKIDPDTPNLDDHTANVVSESIKVNRKSLDLVLLGENQPLRRISEQHRVQVDVFRDRSTLRLTGDPDAILAAKKDLLSLAQGPLSESLIIDSKLQRLLNKGMIQQGFLSALSQKHGVLVERKDDKLNVIASDKLKLSLTMRDLFLAQEEYQLNVGHNVWQGLDLSKTAKAPIYPGDSQDWFASNKQWYRHVALASKSDQKLSSTVDAERLNVLTTLVFNRLKIEGSIRPVLGEKASGDHPNIVYNHAASIGQILTGPAKFGSQASKSRSNFETRESRFVSEIPQLPQMLANLAASTRVSGIHSSTILLRLKPVDRQSILPVFEIYMTGEDPNQGLQQPLQMCKVSAILNQSTFDLLFPFEPVDVRVSRTAQYDLFVQNQSQPDTKYLPLLRTFASIIQQAHNNEMGVPDPILDLDLSGLFVESPTAKQLVPKGNKNSVKPPSIQEITQKPVTYFVSPPELIDACSYPLAAHSGFFLDHVLASAGSKDTPQEPRALRIVESPMCQLVGDGIKPGPAGDRKDVFRKFLEIAVSMASTLGDRARAAGVRKRS